MEENQETELPVRWSVRISLSAFRDARAVIPRLAGRARLRRQAWKLQWWNSGDAEVLDVQCRPIPGVPMWEVLVEEGYGFGHGFRVVFVPLEPDGTIWVLCIMKMGEPVTEAMKMIFQARLNAIVERKDVSMENPFGVT